MQGTVPNRYRGLCIYEPSETTEFKIDMKKNHVSSRDLQKARRFAKRFRIRKSQNILFRTQLQNTIGNEKRFDKSSSSEIHVPSSFNSGPMILTGQPQASTTDDIYNPCDWIDKNEQGSQNVFAYASMNAKSKFSASLLPEVHSSSQTSTFSDRFVFGTRQHTTLEQPFTFPSLRERFTGMVCQESEQLPNSNSDSKFLVDIITERRTAAHSFGLPLLPHAAIPAWVELDPFSRMEPHTRMALPARVGSDTLSARAGQMFWTGAAASDPSYGTSISPSCAAALSKAAASHLLEVGGPATVHFPPRTVLPPLIPGNGGRPAVASIFGNRGFSADGTQFSLSERGQVVGSVLRRR